MAPRRPRITITPPPPNPDRDSRTHVPCGQGAIQQVRSIAARTGLSQREIVSAILVKTDLVTFIRLWTGESLESPTDIYRVLGDGTTVKTATVGGQAAGTSACGDGGGGDATPPTASGHQAPLMRPQRP